MTGGRHLPVIPRHPPSSPRNGRNLRKMALQAILNAEHPRKLKQHMKQNGEKNIGAARAEEAPWRALRNVSKASHGRREAGSVTAMSPTAMTGPSPGAAGHRLGDGLQKTGAPDEDVALPPDIVTHEPEHGRADIAGCGTPPSHARRRRSSPFPPRGRASARRFGSRAAAA